MNNIEIKKMLKIDFLKNYPHAIDSLAQIWYQVLGHIWLPDVPIDRIKQRFLEHLNDNEIPFTVMEIGSAL